MALCLEGVDCIDAVRLLCGETLARKAPAGTIRGDLGMSIQANLVHASDSRTLRPGKRPCFFKKGWNCSITTG